MSFLAPIIGALASRVMGGGQQQTPADQSQSKLVDYMLNKQQNWADPILQNQVMPKLQQRANSAPFYAKQWLGQAKQLRRPYTMNFSKDQSKNPMALSF
jgi:hypothetical protein